jgi:hypothetical protein
MSKDPQEPVLALVPSLQQVVEIGSMNCDRLSVAVEADGHGRIRVVDKHMVPVFDGSKISPWHIGSLRELFRGTDPPPPDLDHYPPEYVPFFSFVENHVLTLCKAQGDRTDQELEEIYAAIRRRPDGRSLGPAHDFVWQIAALLLGLYPLSEAQFTGVFGQLERSVRQWALRPVSRNYVSYLRETWSKLDSRT